MFKKVLTTVLAGLLAVSALYIKADVVLANTPTETLNVSIVGNEANDLYETLDHNFLGVDRFDSFSEAYEDAINDSSKKGIMILADAYPTLTTVDISTQQFETLKEKGIRLYVEYPEDNTVLGIDYDGTAVMGHNRMVVTNKEAFGFDEEQYILYAHGAQFVKKASTLTSDSSTVANPDTTWIVSAKIAGYDTASFGLTDCTPYNLLDVDENVMVATTKFSQFISARYAPYERWQHIWDGILEWLVDDSITTTIEWQPLVDTSYDKEDVLGSSESEILETYANAVDMNTQWYLNSGIMPNKDGSQGIYECYNSGNRFDIYGNQGMRKQLRSDCIGESAGNIALAGVILDNDEYKQIAYNVMDYLLTVSINSQGERADPTSSEYGLLSWDEGNKRVYYGDDNAKAILGMISAAAALEEDKWDERILEAILANFRTAGVNGFRGNRIEGAQLESNGWEYYYNRSVTNYASHYESLLWACYLWAYDKTGYTPLLQRSKTAISMMMDAYKETMKLDLDNGSGEWTWTNGMQQERAKMLLSLAWLYRIEPTQEHLDWIDLMITDMMSYQDATTGALRDVFGQPGEGVGKYGPFTTNSAYGNHEAPVIQENGDPCSDSLYTSAFAMLSLNEAVAATNNATYKQYSDALNNYFVKNQQVSSDAKYDGVWFRGFDYEKWETYGSDGDAAWGIWATETGWSQAWISNTLSMKVLDTNLWDYSKNTTVDDYFDDTATLMLNYDPNDIEEVVTSSVSLRNGADLLIDGVYGSTSWNDGRWAGYEGEDITLTFDYIEEKTFDGMSLGFNQTMASGVCIPASADFYYSNDGVTYTKAATFTGVSDVQAEYESMASDGSFIERANVTFDEVSARYIKVVVKNPGTYERPGRGTTKTWVFMDEFELHITQPTKADLYSLIKECEEIDTSSFKPSTISTFNEELEDAKETYGNREATANEIKEAYEALKAAKEGLSLPLPEVVVSTTNQANSENKNVLTDGNYGKPFVSFKLLLNASAVKNNGATPQEATGTVILDLQEITEIDSLGYTAISQWRYGIFSHQATFYVSDTLDGEYTEVLTLGGKEHEGSYVTEEYHDYAGTLENVTGRYVKVVFERDGQFDGTVGPNGKMYAEWLYVTEIDVNQFYPIILDCGENGTITSSAHERGAVRGEDVTITLTPQVGYVLDTFSVDGNAATLEDDGTYVIENVKEKHTVSATFKEKTFPENELPTLNVHDLFVVAGEEVDLLCEVSAFDKNGVDITSEVKVIESTLEPTPGTYSVTYEVKDALGAKRKASVKVNVLSEASDEYEVVMITPSATDNLTTMAQQLLDGKYAAGTSHSNAEYVSWQNIKSVDVIIDLKEEADLYALGYSLLSNPRLGIFKPDVEFYVCNELGTTWTSVGSVEASKHTGAVDESVIERNKINVDANARYVKLVFKFDETAENLDPYKDIEYEGRVRTFKPEWNFIDEITIEQLYKVTTEITGLGEVNVSENHTDGSLYGESVSIEFVPEEGYVLKEVKVNGNIVEVEENTYVIEEVTGHSLVEAIFEIDVTLLEEEIDIYNSTKEEDYTTDSYEAYKDAIEEGMALLDSDEITVDALNEVLAAIEEAKENLVDVAYLKEIVEIIEDMDLSKYSEESVATLKEALENAKETFVNGTNESVEEAKQALIDAYENLEEAPKEATDTGDSTNVGGLLALLLASAYVLFKKRKVFEA